jgi:hypothetical protein
MSINKNLAALVLSIKLSEDGNITTSHRPLTKGDAKVLQEWPAGGLAHVAHALMTESIRKETYVMALSMLSTGRKLEDLTAKDIEEAVRAHYMKMLDHFSGEAAESVLAMLKES